MKKFIIVLILLCFCAPVMASEYPKVSRRNIVINERTGEQVQTKEKQSSYQVLKQKLLDAQEENENLVRIIES